MPEMTLGELKSDAISKYIATTFGVQSGESKNYAKIAAYLSDKDKFLKHLGRVDKWLASIYAEALQLGAFEKSPQGDELRPEKPYNVTSRLLNAAANSVGWGTGGNLVLSGFTHSPDFVEIVRRKLMWKDMVASAHGEFTHSIQWLIVYSFMGSLAPALYAKACDFQGIAEGPWKDKYLWDFIVDCFPSPPANAVDWSNSVQTNTGRSPTIANVWIQDSGGFIGERLKARYIRRKWTPPSYDGGVQTVGYSHEKHLGGKPIGGGYDKGSLTKENARNNRKAFEASKNYRGLVTTYSGKPNTPSEQKEKKTGLIFARRDSQLATLDSALRQAVSKCPFHGGS